MALVKLQLRPTTAPLIPIQWSSCWPQIAVEANNCSTGWESEDAERQSDGSSTASGSVTSDDEECHLSPGKAANNCSTGWESEDAERQSDGSSTASGSVTSDGEECHLSPGKAASTASGTSGDESNISLIKAVNDDGGSCVLGTLSMRDTVCHQEACGLADPGPLLAITRG